VLPNTFFPLLPGQEGRENRGTSAKLQPKGEEGGERLLSRSVKNVSERRKRATRGERLFRESQREGDCVCGRRRDREKKPEGFQVPEREIKKERANERREAVIATSSS